MAPQTRSKSHPTISPTTNLLTTPNQSYTYTPTEKGIFTPSPYKAHLLPLWRFKTVPEAQRSAEAIWAAFLQYAAHDDFVGMDNARKFLQMGMTRAARYANHPGGRKYRDSKEKVEHADAGSKREASLIFREYWDRAKTHPGYVSRKEEWLKRQRSRQGG